MERKEFLEKSLRGLGSFLVAVPIISACNKAEEVSPTTTTGSTNGNSASNCTVTPSETEGPFPIKNPSSLVITNIKGDRSGVPLTVKISIKNKNTSCGNLAGVMVDIWHCDAAGNYSEYGNTQMQKTDYTSVHWLRGRQTTDANGVATFATIYPGWYSGRAPHIHVNVLSASGKSLLVTQIAFPKATCDTVYSTASDYKSHGTQDTTNEKDNVFSDGVSNEMASVDGSVSAGYNLTHTIVVSA